MSDYEYESENENVIVPVVVVLKNQGEEKKTTIFIKFYCEDIYDAEDSNYKNYQPAINSIAERRYPGWTVSHYITEESYNGTYYDLDYSMSSE